MRCANSVLTPLGPQVLAHVLTPLLGLVLVTEPNRGEVLVYKRCNINPAAAKEAAAKERGRGERGRGERGRGERGRGERGGGSEGSNGVGSGGGRGGNGEPAIQTPW